MALIILRTYYEHTTGIIVLVQHDRMLLVLSELEGANIKGNNKLKLFVYSTDQMQGIRRTRFDHILNAFIASNERVCRYRRTRLALDTNAFNDGDGHI